MRSSSDLLESGSHSLRGDDRQCDAKRQVPFADFKTRILFGLSLSAFSVVYLWLATRVIMPWFRSGVEVHYFSSYFKRFGTTAEEIVTTIFLRPDVTFGALVTPETGLYALALLAPLAFLPLLAPSRLAVGLPLFAILCLIELEGANTPQHQFHAPLVAIIFWSLAAALPKAASLGKAVMRRFGHPTSISSGFLHSATCCLDECLEYRIVFQPESARNPILGSRIDMVLEATLQPTSRAEMFARITNLIPHSSRVASTDFVHPRFTHYERSYDYSEYVRDVNGRGNRIPDDTDYLVIDTDHRYSRIKKPSDIPELRDQPDQWELLPDLTDGYFIVLKRKSK